MIKVLGLALLVAVFVSACDPQPVRTNLSDVPESIPASQSPDIVTSIEDSLRYLAEEGDRWMQGKARVQDGTGCVSCHHVGFALWSHHEAERAGVRLSERGIDDLRRRAHAFQAGQSQVVPATQMILAEVHQDSDVHALDSNSEPDGRWRAKGQFPRQRRGEEEGDGVASLWALVALASLESLDETTQVRRDRALEWLSTAPDGISNEWNAARLIVEFQSGHDERAGALLDKLFVTQHEDGGWGWLEGDPSNPFSTGQSIYALSIVDGERSVDAIQRGVDYLLARQQADGTWLTPSKYTSAKESKDRDYIYQYWGTAWASIGLSRILALENQAAEPRISHSKP